MDDEQHMATEESEVTPDAAVEIVAVEEDVQEEPPAQVIAVVEETVIVAAPTAAITAVASAAAASPTTQPVTDRILAALSYLSVLFLVPLIIGRRKLYVYGHLQQGTVMFALGVIVGFLAWIPYLGPLILIAFVALSLVAIVQALRGEDWRIPRLGGHAAKLRI